MIEIPPASPGLEAEEALRAEEASRYEAHFWHQTMEGGSLDEYSPGYKDGLKVDMVKGVLHSNTGPVAVKASPHLRDKYKSHEFTDWRPQSPGEAYTITHHGGARKSLRALEGYWKSSRKNLGTLNLGINTQGINFRQVLHNYDLLYALGDNLLARECWARLEWPDRTTKDGKKQYQERRDFFRGLMVASARLADSSESLKDLVADLYMQVLDEAILHDGYWTVECNTAPNPAGQVAMASTTEVANESGTSVAEPELEGEARYEALMSKDEQQDLEARRKAYAERWEYLDQAGMPQKEKLETIWREFPEFIPPEIAYAEEIREMAIRRALAEPPPPRRQRPYTAHFQDSTDESVRAARGGQ